MLMRHILLHHNNFWLIRELSLLHERPFTLLSPAHHFCFHNLRAITFLHNYHLSDNDQRFQIDRFVFPPQI